jgi:hypothetical protein
MIDEAGALPWFCVILGIVCFLLWRKSKRDEQPDYDDV